MADVADLVFDCVGAHADRYAVTPSLTLRLRITAMNGATGAAAVDAIALRCQLRIEPHRRRYSADEAERLHDLFGDPDRWADTLKPMQLATLSVMVPGFTGSTEIDLPLPVTYDLEIATTKYFHGLVDGVIPLLLLFSGTVFTTTETGQREVRPVPWSKEASCQLPVKVWRETVDLHFPNSGWLRLHRDTLDELQRFKSSNSLATWDDTLTVLLRRAEPGSPV